MPSKPAKLDVVIAADDVGSARCLHIPPNALLNVELPARLIIEGPRGQSRLVGWKRIDYDAADRSVVGVASSLLRSLAPDAKPQDEVEATVRSPTRLDVVIYTPGESAAKTVGAFLALIVAILGGAVALADSRVPLSVGAALFIVGIVAALFSAWAAIHDAVSIDCSK